MEAGRARAPKQASERVIHVDNLVACVLFWLSLGSGEAMRSLKTIAVQQTRASKSRLSLLDLLHLLLVSSPTSELAANGVSPNLVCYSSECAPPGSIGVADDQNAREHAANKAHFGRRRSPRPAGKVDLAIERSIGRDVCPLRPPVCADEVSRISSRRVSRFPR